AVGGAGGAGAACRPRRGGRRVADGGQFSYLTGQPLFDIHGWRVEISRRRAQIVRVDSVSAAGFSLSGAGSLRVRTPGLFEPERRYDICVTGPGGENSYRQRADEWGRLTFTGRLAAAMHDPIIPGRRTQHFTALGQDEVTMVRIASAPEESEETATEARGDVSDPAHGKGPQPAGGPYIDSGRGSATADRPTEPCRDRSSMNRPLPAIALITGLTLVGCSGGQDDGQDKGGSDAAAEEATQLDEATLKEILESTDAQGQSFK